MSRAPAPAKVNLALVVGPLRDDRKHEVLTVLQRIDLVDRIELKAARELRVEGFADDTLVSNALRELAHGAGVEPRWRVRIEKRIPVAAGLGGGSSDAATALRLANETLPEPRPPEELRSLAAQIGADVPFFLADGPQLGSGDGSELEPLDLPQDFWVVVLLPRDATKTSTADVYSAFDTRHDVAGFLAQELVRREELGYPPFSNLVTVVVSGPSPEGPSRALAELHEALRLPGVQLLGPAPLLRLRGKHRSQLVAKTVEPRRLAARAAHLLSAAAPAMRRAGLSAVVDVDPQSL